MKYSDYTDHEPEVLDLENDFSDGLILDEDLERMAKPNFDTRPAAADRRPSQPRRSSQAQGRRQGSGQTPMAEATRRISQSAGSGYTQGAAGSQRRVQESGHTQGAAGSQRRVQESGYTQGAAGSQAQRAAGTTSSERITASGVRRPASPQAPKMRTRPVEDDYDYTLQQTGSAARSGASGARSGAARNRGSYDDDAYAGRSARSAGGAVGSNAARNRSAYDEDAYADGNARSAGATGGNGARYGASEASLHDTINRNGRSAGGSSGGDGGNGGFGRNSRKKPANKKRRWTIAISVVAVMMVIGLIGIFGALKIFEIKSGESLSECIADGKRIAAESKREDFLTGNKSYIYAEDGSLIRELRQGDDSTYLTYDKIPQHAVNAFIAIEDQKFWTNDGTDPKGMVRVLYTFVRSRGKTMQGASTITQQLIKLTYLSSEKSLSRKVKEIVIAKELTKSGKYSKEDIMEFYCNTCCFANAVYGLQDAAKTYFNKNIGDLSLSQIAYLCAIPNRPEYYNPKTHPENAIDRRDKILRDMKDQGMITSAEYNEAVNETITIAEVSERTTLHNYETTYATNCVAKYFMKHFYDFQFRYVFNNDDDYKQYLESYNEVYEEAMTNLTTGGYRIYTTIDMQKQAQLQSILDQALEPKQSRLDNGIYQVQGAMTVIDNETGKVVCVIGGRSQDEVKNIYTLNRAYQGYAQPGSSIKPLVVYTPAMDNDKFNTASLLQNIDVSSAKGKDAATIASMTGSPVYLRSAVENSLNGCAYWLMCNNGISNCVSYLPSMNFEKVVPGDYTVSTALGGMNYGVTTEEMANAYYTLENDGMFRDTNCIKSILDNKDEEIYEEEEERRVYNESACRKMTDVMKGVLTVGTAHSSNWYSNTSTEAAGKTGTTNDCKAGWFCGYTPYYTISVWVGCDTPVEISDLYGSTYPLTIWKNAMLTMIDGKPTAKFPSIPYEEPEVLECTCTEKCTAEKHNDECMACKMNIANCKAVECICEKLCFGDGINELCPVCLKDHLLCKGKEEDCSCTYHCSEAHVEESCLRCRENMTNCMGTEEWKEEEHPQDPGSSESGGSESGGNGSGGNGSGSGDNGSGSGSGGSGSGSGGNGSGGSGDGGHGSGGSDSGSGSHGSGGNGSGSGGSGDGGNGDGGSTYSEGGERSASGAEAHAETYSLEEP